MFHFHKYSDWTIVESGKVVDAFDKDDQIGSYITQSRFCPACGKTQLTTQQTCMRHGVLVPTSTKTGPKRDSVRSTS